MTTGEPLSPALPHEGRVAAVAVSPDRKTLITATLNVAQLWDTATGQPLGTPLAHDGLVSAVAFSPDGKTAITSGMDNAIRFWDVTETVADDLEVVATRMEVLTGIQIDAREQSLTLDNAGWRERRDRLARLDPRPATAEGPRVDPILFGPDPTARAKAYIKRGRWAEAEAAFDEAVEARPAEPEIRRERAVFLAGRSRAAEAESDFARAFALGSRDARLLEAIDASEPLFRRITSDTPESAAFLWLAAARPTPASTYGARPRRNAEWPPGSTPARSAAGRRRSWHRRSRAIGPS